MIKMYCDCCGKEINDRHTFNHLVHIENNLDVCGYSDSEGNRISSRDVKKDVCIKCYNSIYHKAMNEFNKIKESVECNTKK